MMPLTGSVPLEAKAPVTLPEATPVVMFPLNVGALLAKFTPALKLLLS